MSDCIGRDEFERRLLEIDGRFKNVTPGIPAGMIMIWSGTLASIPVGWHLCDGTAGTPNLGDKFVLGARTGGFAPGSTGGAWTHSHSNHSDHYDHSDHPALSHSGMTVSDHSGRSELSGNVSEIEVFSGAGDLGHAVTQPNNHGAQSHSTHGSHSAHSNADHTNPYYVLAFIMKL